MIWCKIANIFDPREVVWAGSHAQVPTVLVKDDVLRVYYAARTPEGRSYITFFDVDRADPRRTVYFHKDPVLSAAAPGTFDDEGMMPGCVIQVEDAIYLYYSGWNRRLTVPYHNATGLAASRDGGTSFTRVFDGPILDRSPDEPYLAVTPWVLREDSRWRMWYTSGLSWRAVEDKFEPSYTIKYADSSDGISWVRPNITCIHRRHELEACTHPAVVRLGGLYHMWFCFRGSEDYRNGPNSYRIGYARSRDGLEWLRSDEEAGISLSDAGWDAEMLCYPYVVHVDSATLMFYNGNGFGQSGIGYAVLEGSELA